jgi:hypothetical protein
MDADWPSRGAAGSSGNVSDNDSDIRLFFAPVYYGFPFSAFTDLIAVFADYPMSSNPPEHNIGIEASH